MKNVDGVASFYAGVNPLAAEPRLPWLPSAPSWIRRRNAAKDTD